MSVILAAESSCDETAIAIYSTESGIITNHIYSQISLHSKYGGVVPELAARDHMMKLPILLKKSIKSAQVSLNDVDFFAYTAGPGLVGALMTGATFICSLAYAHKKPVIRINHMEGHLLSPMLAPDSRPKFPFVALLVSGGHTQLMAVDSVGKYRLLGQTLDDAVGEAFDKTAKLMGLGYPGGPALSKLAESGDPNSFTLSRPMVNRPGMDMSFSGLKTQVRLLIEKCDRNIDQVCANIAASFEKAVVDTLVVKCRRALLATGYHSLVVAGGVSANKVLRDELQHLATSMGKQVFFPPLELCGDNAAMIAYAAAQRISSVDTDPLIINVKARWSLSELS